MERKPLHAHTKARVTRLGLGCWQASAGWASHEPTRAADTLRAALDGGVQILDTAPFYGEGASERLVGQALGGRREDALIATKLAVSEGRPEEVRKSLEGSLERLGTDHVDVLYLPALPPDVAPDEAIEAMEQLRDEGKLRWMGASDWMEPQLAACRSPQKVEVLQPVHNLLWRPVEHNTLFFAKRYGMGMLPCAPLCQGLLTGRFENASDIPRDMRAANQRATEEGMASVREVNALLREIAQGYAATPAQVALRWLLDLDGITAPVVGSSHPQQLQENLGALGWSLDAGDWERLSEHTWAMSESIKPHQTLWGERAEMQAA